MYLVIHHRGLEERRVDDRLQGAGSSSVNRVTGSVELGLSGLVVASGQQQLGDVEPGEQLGGRVLLDTRRQAVHEGQRGGGV